MRLASVAMATPVFNKRACLLIFLHFTESRGYYPNRAVEI